MSAPRGSLVTGTRCRAGAAAACRLAGSGDGPFPTGGDGAEGRGIAAPPGRGITTGSDFAGRGPDGRAFPATATARMTGPRLKADGGLSLL